MEINWLLVWAIGFVVTGLALIGLGHVKNREIYRFADVVVSFIVVVIWLIYIPWKIIQKAVL